MVRNSISLSLELLPGVGKANIIHRPGADLLLEPRLTVKTRTAAVLCNRFLVESGLHRRHPGLPLSSAYSKFRTKLVAGKGLTQRGATLLKNITRQSGMTVKAKDVVNDLNALIHQLSSAASLVDCENSLPVPASL